MYGRVTRSAFARLGRAFFPLPNKWGEKGATTVILDAVTEEELREALERAWELHQ